MAFRYSAPPLTQGAVSLVLVGAFVGLAQVPAVQTAWAAWLETHAVLHFLVAILVLHGLVYWGICAICAYVETHDKPAFIARYRIQTGKVRRPPRDKVIKNLALNQVLITPVMLGLLWGALQLRGWSVDPVLPSFTELMLDLLGLSIISPIWFYASHRFLHRPWWMKRFHRVHHEFRTTAAWAAEYAHPVEMIFGNFGTLAFGVVILGPDLATIYLYTVLGTLTFVGHHTGFAVPWLSWAVHHDWHHYKYTEAFGTYGVLDRLLGTDAEFRQLEDGEVVK